MIVALPSEVTNGCFVDCLRDFAEVSGNVMFETLMTDELEQPLQLRNLRHARAAEGLEGIVGELAWPGIAANDAAAIVGGVPCKGHRSGFHFAHAGAESVLLTHGAGNDLLVVHPDILEEMFGQVGAMEADALVGIAAVIVVPVE